MSRLFTHTEADRLAESIALHQEIVAQLVAERERVDQSLAYYRAELDWLDRCNAFIAGPDILDPLGPVSGSPARRGNGTPPARGCASA
jgi:hypothetical protein